MHASSSARPPALDDSPPPPALLQKPFDFTKRRRWTDVLLSALPGAALLVLSKTGVIQYSAPSTRAALGWEVEDVVEKNVLEFVHDDDKAAFSACFRRALTRREELVCFTRLKRRPCPPPASTATAAAGTSADPPSPQPQQDVLLFDIRGRGLFLDFELDGEPHDTGGGNGIWNRNEEEMVPGTVLFFLVAKPYPSRNVAMLNTFLELKIEHERLSQRLTALRLEDEAEAAAAATAVGLGHSLPPAFASAASNSTSTSLAEAGDASNPYLPLVFKERGFGSVKGGAGAGTALGGRPGQESAYGEEDGEQEGAGRRKKQKRAHDPSSSGSADDTAKDPTRSHSTTPTSTTATATATATATTSTTSAKPQYVCFTCGRTDSPEWRRGPTGPKTLCNACGLRWAKHAKVSAGVVNANVVNFASGSGSGDKPGSARGVAGRVAGGGGGGGGGPRRKDGNAVGTHRARGAARRERDAPVAHKGMSVTPPEALDSAPAPASASASSSSTTAYALAAPSFMHAHAHGHAQPDRPPQAQSLPYEHQHQHQRAVSGRDDFDYSGAAEYAAGAGNGAYDAFATELPAYGPYAAYAQVQTQARYGVGGVPTQTSYERAEMPAEAEVWGHQHQQHQQSQSQSRGQDGSRQRTQGQGQNGYGY